jgi:hypothetical protein
MGKADAPPVPDYTKAAIATSNLGKFTETGPTGAVRWSLRPGADQNNPQPGDYIRSTELSHPQQQLYDQGVGNQLSAGKVGGQLLGEIGQGTQGVEDALYRRATQHYSQNFGDQEAALRTRLENSGLTAGSEGYDKQLRNFGQTRDAAYADATDRALLGADQSQNSAVSRLAQILSMSRGQMPTSQNIAAGPDLNAATQATYQGNLGNVNAQNAQMGNLLSTAGQLGSAFLMSDIRLKSNLRPVRTAPNSLCVYDYEIGGKPQRGYIAQEVREKFPDAVRVRPDGYLEVNYESLGGMPE